MDRWLNEIGDNPELPEAELIKRLWNGNDSQPVTLNPVVTLDNGKIKITCKTKGASIGYKIVSNGNTPKSWEIYQGPFKLPEGARLMVKAHRIGFLQSNIVKL